MNSNGKRLVATVLSLAMVTTMVACGNVRPKGVGQDTMLACVTYSDDIEHLVKKGDTLYEISKKYYNSSEYWQELAFYNGINNPKEFIANTIARVPRTAKKLLKATGGHVHPIVEGDTLSAICLQYYGTQGRDTVWKLATYNGLEDPRAIFADHFLRVPSKEELDKVKAHDYSGVVGNPLTLK